MSGRAPRRAVVAAATAFALLGSLPAAAPGAPAPLFRDRVLGTGLARHPVAHAAGVASTGPEAGYRAQDGQVVMVSVSRAVADGPAVAQRIVDFLGSRVHGLELGRLRVLIGTPTEIQSACGGDSHVLACYSAGERRMYIPDRDPSAGNRAGFTRDYAVTHEYGHHIANFRSNDPWPALDWGAKYWSSYEHVCAGVRARRLYPGNQGDHYLDDPGEGFADAYAHMHYPDVPWQYNDSLRPDAGAFAALRRDILDPWRVVQRRSLRGALGPARLARATSFRVSLDGRVDVRLSGPAGADYDVALYAGSQLLDRTRRRGSRQRLRVTLCRGSGTTTGIGVRVIRRRGSGPFNLDVTYPG
jgi:hypothetical protein